MIPEQMRKENIRRIGINSVLFLSIHYPVKWVVSGAVSFDVLSINSVLFLSIHYPVKWVVSGAVSFDVLSIISSI